MKSRQTFTGQGKLFEQRLSSFLNPNHKLFQLADVLPWKQLEQDLDSQFQDGPGQPPLPIRLVIGLVMLSHMCGLSDIQVVTQWVDRPYWQYFCGYAYFQWKLPCDPSSLTRWRKRLGEEGLNKMLAMTIQVAVELGVVTPKELAKVIADTTVMEKNVRFPTDSSLLNKAREKLVKLARKTGIKLRQSYTRIGLYMKRKVDNYAPAKQYNRMARGVKTLKTYLGRVVRDVERAIAGANTAIQAQFSN